MAAHRYWRLFISETGGASHVTIGELVLSVAAAGPQAAAGGVASASSSFAGTTAANAFDGSETVAWASLSGVYSSKGMEHIQYDMGVGNAIDVIEMRVSYNSTSAIAYPRAFALLHSDDGTKWTLRRAWGGQVFALGETKTFDATLIPANQVFNRVLADKAAHRHTLAANAGEPALRRVLGRTIGLHAHASKPLRFTPWSGQNYIAGSTTVLGQPFARRVNLVEQRSGLLVDTVHTGDDGAFIFEGIGDGPWSVIGVDMSAEQNSVIFAHVVAEQIG